MRLGSFLGTSTGISKNKNLFYFFAARRNFLCIHLVFVTSFHKIFEVVVMRNQDVFLRNSILFCINDRAKLSMDNYIRVSSDRRGEMSIDRHIQGIVDPSFSIGFADNKILGLLQQKDQFIVQDIFDALLNLCIFKDLFEFLLDFYVLRDFDGMIDFLCEFLEFLDLLGTWELMLSQQGTW